jgi:hypothetical protein
MQSGSGLTMTPEIIVLYLLYSSYKLGSLAAGVAFAFMGYRLFLNKLPDPQQGGEASASWSSMSLTMKKAAPGAFFAFFGTLITRHRAPGIQRDFLTGQPKFHS